MKAMIMAAGVGSRLMPLTANIPKPMVPVGNIPLMERIVKLLKEHGFYEIICNLHYHPDIIYNHFGDGKKYGVTMQYSLENQLMGTAGGVKKCQWFLDDTFVVISGDILTDINLERLLKTHLQKGALATIALKEVEQVEQFGVVITNEKGRIINFQEKPSLGEALSHNANTGIYVFEPEIFKYIPDQEFHDFGKQVFPYLVKIGAPFYGTTVKEYWCDVGNISTYCQAHSDILQQQVKIDIVGEIFETLDGSSRILMGEETSIGKNVRFAGDVVIGSGCWIGDNTYISNSIIWDNNLIKEKSIFEKTIIGYDGVAVRGS
ncbi:MAG: sugar phosphate nucleotidyltransferase [Syntrophomonadaceae bacterium]|jgi:mannose-1-phosphate guanylyltransferase